MPQRFLLDRIGASHWLQHLTILLFGAHILAFSGLYAQPEYVNSDERHQLVEAQLSITMNGTDSAKVRAFAKLYRLFANINPEKASRYAKRGSDLADQTRIDVLIAGSSMNLANSVELAGDYEKAQKLYRKSLRHFRAIPDSLGMSMCLGNHAGLLNSIAKYDSAIILNRQVLSIARNIGDVAGVVIAMEAIATNFRVLGQIDSAVHYYSLCLDRFTELEAEEERGVTLSNMGLLFSDFELYDKSRSYLDEARRIFKSLKAKNQLAHSYRSIGVLLLRQQRLDSARLWLNRAYLLFDSLGYQNQKAEVIAHMCELMLSEGNPQQALVTLETAKGLVDEDYDFRIIANIEVLSGDALLMIGKPDEALPYFEHVAALGKTNRAAILQLKAMDRLAMCYRALDDREQSLHYQHLRSSLFDSLRSQTNYAGLAQLQAEYGASAIKLLEKDIALEQQKYDTQLARNEAQEALIMTLILAVAFLTMVFLWFRARSKGLLRKQVLKEREQGIRSMIKADHEIRVRVARDLHDGLGQILSSMRLHLGSFRQKVTEDARHPDAELENLDKLVCSAVEEVRTISYFMMPMTLRKEGLVVAIKEMLINGLDQERIAHHFDHQVDESLISEEVRVNLYRVCQELVSNTVRHASASHLEVLLATTQKHILLVTEDDGIGIQTKTASQKSSGLSNIKSRIEVLNGTYDVDKRQPHGTLTRIKIPLET